MFNNNPPVLSGTDRWTTNYKNDFLHNDVRFVSPRYQQRPKEQPAPTPRPTGRRHFPNSQIAHSSLNFSTGEQLPPGVLLRSIGSESGDQSGFNSGPNSHFASPAGSPRKVARLSGSVQPPWGVQFRNVVPITVYQSSSHASCGAVGMLVRLLGLRANYVEVNIMAGEEKSEKFRQTINPAGTLPVINDEGFKLSEHRAILRYLVTKYGYKNNSLYPEHLPTRARIESWLDYDIGTLSPAVNEFVGPSLVRQSGDGSQSNSEERQRKLEAVLDHLNSHLQVSSYICGSQLTLADISLVSTLALLDAVRFPLGPNRSSLNTWMLRMKGIRQFQDSFGQFYAIMGSMN